MLSAFPKTKTNITKHILIVIHTIIDLVLGIYFFVVMATILPFYFESFFPRSQNVQPLKVRWSYTHCKFTNWKRKEKKIKHKNKRSVRKTYFECWKMVCIDRKREEKSPQQLTLTHIKTLNLLHTWKHQMLRFRLKILSVWRRKVIKEEEKMLLNEAKAMNLLQVYRRSQTVRKQKEENEEKND